jgi:hypothetical protein
MVHVTRFLVLSVSFLIYFTRFKLRILGERGNRWIRHEQKLNYTVPFQVLIEGVVGPSLYSDIGLDDTIFTPDCNFYSLPTLPVLSSTTTARPTITVASCPLADDFRCATSNVCVSKAQVRLIFYRFEDQSILFFFRDAILLLIVLMNQMRYEEKIFRIKSNILCLFSMDVVRVLSNKVCSIKTS